MSALYTFSIVVFFFFKSGVDDQENQTEHLYSANKGIGVVNSVIKSTFSAYCLFSMLNLSDVLQNIFRLGLKHFHNIIRTLKMHFCGHMTCLHHLLQW